MSTTTPVLGLRTAIYVTNDLEKAKAWYTDWLATAPYFDHPFYVGFNVGGYELGLVPAEGVNQAGSGGVLTYWGVPNAAEAAQRLESLGAVPREPLQDVGEGIMLATFFDPFGNILGIIENPVFKLP